MNRLVFCMFADDVGLLPDRMFDQLLERASDVPDLFADMASALFAAMSTGGPVGFVQVPWFNGGLFADDTALALEAPEIDTIRAAASLDWSQIDPSILGTLFERGLDPDKRSQLGAHYTDRDKIMQIVEPVVVRPWRERWAVTKAEIERLMGEAASAATTRTRSNRRQRAQQAMRDFLTELRSFTVLDPACGSGNFLYIALQELKDLEHQFQLEAESIGVQRSFPQINPENVYGIEINPYAAELARVAVWIGQIQWMRRNGFTEERDPILKPIETIECRDAIIAVSVNDDGEPVATEPAWPEADAIIGNPPFLGGKKLREFLGDPYVAQMFRIYRGRVRAEADLVCYWIDKACRQIRAQRSTRAGLVATNSIRGGSNRQTLQTATKDLRIFDAWGDEPWVVEGADVNVSLICIEVPSDDGRAPMLDGKPVDIILPDLRGRIDGAGIDITLANKVAANRDIAFMGCTSGAKFDVPKETAYKWLQEPANPNGLTNAVVVRPTWNGFDVTRRPSGRWIVDFGPEMLESDAAMFQEPFEWLKKTMLPSRTQNQKAKYRRHWWRFTRPRPAMRNALKNLKRFIVVPATSKYRVLQWCHPKVCPDNALIVIAREDDTTFGVLHSRFHVAWSLRLGTEVVNRPRYTPTTTFETFPFPEALTPDVDPVTLIGNPEAAAIAEAAERLVELRDIWLHPSEWVVWEDAPVAGFPQHPTPVDGEAARQLKKRTLTNLYNTNPQWLQDAHADLDAAVAAAYGWPTDISVEDALAKLMELNQSQ